MVASVNALPEPIRVSPPEGARSAMLYLTRKLGESVVINDEIEVTVVDVKGKSAKLGITFPEHATVLRREVYDRIQAENAAAAAASAAALSEALAADASPLASRDRRAGKDAGRSEDGGGGDTNS